MQSLIYGQTSGQEPATIGLPVAGGFVCHFAHMAGNDRQNVHRRNNSYRSPVFIKHNPHRCGILPEGIQHVGQGHMFKKHRNRLNTGLQRKGTMLFMLPEQFPQIDNAKNFVGIPFENRKEGMLGNTGCFQNFF